MTSDTHIAAEKGLAALRSGDVGTAYSLLSEAVAHGDARRNTLMALAFAARAAKQPADSLRAADKVLALEPGNIEALILKADALSATGEQRMASSCYLTAVKAAPPPERLAPQLAAEIDRARKACAAAAVHYEEFLRAKVGELGVFDGSGRARGEQAMDVLFGRRQIYYQQPEKFYFPELPQIQFYDAADFSWTESLLGAASAIRRELDAILSEGGGFEPYVPARSTAPHVQSNALMGNEDWGAFHLIKDGVRIDANAARCPATMDALKAAPAPAVRGKSPVALFSRLKPGAHIPPHTGLMNTRLICHLPVISPEGCVLRVGNQERSWRDGEMLIFDDSIEHEARNASTSDRIILLFDIWRPELSEDERAFIETIFAAIEDYGVFS